MHVEELGLLPTPNSKNLQNTNLSLLSTDASQLVLVYRLPNHILLRDIAFHTAATSISLEELVILIIVIFQTKDTSTERERGLVGRNQRYVLIQDLSSQSPSNSAR